MDEGKLAADFVANNIEKIWGVAKESFGTIDEVAQIKFKTAYTEYLKVTQGKYAKSKSFFIRNQSVDLYSYYVPMGIRCNQTVIDKPSFEACVKNSSHMVISGVGGSGKSVLMRHLFLDCIKHKKYTPILIELRALNANNKSLDYHVKNTLEMFGFNTSGDYIKRAQKAGHFCFFLDGYDEVNHSLREKLIDDIKILTNKYSECPIIISTRPDDVFNGIDDFDIFNILPLTVKTASTLIKKLPFDEEIKDKFIESLGNGLFIQHESFLSNPLLLSIMLLTYGENAEIPSKLSIFYNQAYEALFQRHDANKGGYSRSRLTDLDIQDFSKVFSLFALQTYERRLFKMSRIDCLNFIEKSRSNLNKNFKPEDYLKDLLSAACLLMEDGLEIIFSHRSFQEYFVALHISTAAPEIQEKLILRYSRNMDSDNVISLLYEINPDLIERVLIIPKLKALFDEIGVKNKVGITHTVKYLKVIYNRINISDESFTLTVNNDNYEYDLIADMAVRNYYPYNFPSKEYFDGCTKRMYQKYGEKGAIKQYKLESLSYKTPLIVDMLNLSGIFSIDYVQYIHEAYKSLKTKHEKRVSNIDELLGIV